MSPKENGLIGSNSVVDEPYLGGEKPHFDEAQEKSGVEEILQALAAEGLQLPEPTMAIRHFRAEKGNVKKAIEKIKQTLEWREQFGVDRVVKAWESGDEEMKNILLEENSPGKIYIRGYDSEGRALMYMRPGRENTHNEENNMRHLVYNLEKAIACTKRKSKLLSKDENAPPLEKINLLIDYDGFKVKNSPPMSTSRRTLDILQKHYPERMYRAYVLNPPLVFRTFWTIIRPFVDPVTKEKIVFCSGKSGMQKFLDAVEDKHKLERVAGGTEELRDFDSKEFLQLPFDIGFDEDTE